MMCWDDVWTWQHIVGNNSRDLFTGSAFSSLTLKKKINTFSPIQIREEDKEEIVSDAHTHTHTAPGNTLKGKQMDELTQTHKQSTLFL